jgi:hypothetical protein
MMSEDAQAEEAGFGQAPSLTINRDRALRCASFAGALVLAMLLSLFSRGYASGAAQLATIVLLFYALRGSEVWIRFAALPHFLALGPLLIGLFGLCQSACGGLSYYDRLLGIPTDWLAIAVHLGTGFVVASRLFPAVVGYSLITLAVGGSLTYLGVLLGHGFYCAPCLAVHAMMIAQGLLLLHSHRDWHGFAYGGWILAWAGILNLFFHHQPVQPVRNDPERLYDYLTTMWTAQRPPQRIVGTHEAVEPMLIDDEDMRPASRQTPDTIGVPVSELRDEPPDDLPSANDGPIREDDPPPSMPRPEVPAYPPEMGMLGDPQAPVLVRINFDFKCPACGAFFREIMSLLDLVQSGHIRIEFLFTYADTTSQAASTFAYACSAKSERLFIEVSRTLMAKMSILNSPQDCVLAVRELIGIEELKGLITSHREAIGAMLVRTERIRLLNGTTGTPTVWIHDRHSNEPQRVFSGFVSAAAMRLSIDTVLKSR